MVLIAESGSTKTDWVAFSNESNTDTRFKTVGINPHILSTSEITKQLFESTSIKAIAASVKHIHFYGAGCSSASMKKVVKDALRSMFPTAKIDIYHDLEGAVRSTWSGQKAITSILGTGSNCCLFDGTEIKQNKPSLGYLLGDEGSGNHIGGKLYKSVVYKEAPEDIRSSFIKEFNFTHSDLVTLLYSKAKPNEFLASFMPFVKSNREHPFIKNIILEGFNSFVKTHIKAFEEYPTLKCHFVGSVSYHFQAELREVLNSNGLSIGSVLQSPLEGLVQYHRKG